MTDKQCEPTDAKLTIGSGVGYVREDIHNDALQQITEISRAMAQLVDGDWADKPDDLTETVTRAHPYFTKDYDTYTKAISLVSNRHSKYALVDLVNYLLSENKRLDSLVDSYVEAQRW